MRDDVVVFFASDSVTVEDSSPGDFINGYNSNNSEGVLSSVYHLSDTDDGNRTRFLIFVLLNIWATCSNGLVLFVMCRSRVLRRSFGCVVVSLSTADLLTSLLITPVAIYYYYNCSSWHFGTVGCVGWVTLNIFLCTASISHHCCIAVNRYLAVARPHQHGHIKMATTATLLYRVILPSWSAGFIFAIILGVQATMRPEIVVTAATHSVNSTSSSVSSVVVACGVVDRPFVIYTSVASLVPLAITLLANIGSILVLRRRLKRREVLNMQYSSQRRSSDLALGAMDKTVDVDNNSNNNNNNDNNADGKDGILNNENTSPNRARNSDESGTKQQAQQPPPSRWSLSNFGKLIDFYLAETSVVNEGGLSLRKRLSIVRAGSRRLSSTGDLQATINAVNQVPRPSSLSLQGGGEAPPKKQSARPSRYRPGGLTANRSSFALTINGPSIVGMDSIREDEQESAFDSGMTPIDRCDSNPAQQSDRNSYVSMTSVLFGDDCNSLQDTLALFSTVDYEYSSTSSTDNDDETDSDFWSGSGSQQPQSQQQANKALTKQQDDKLAKESRQTLFRGRSEHYPRPLIARKRAFSVDLPVRYLFAQKAPLAKFESKSSFSLLQRSSTKRKYSEHIGRSTLKPPYKHLGSSKRKHRSSRRNRCNTQPSHSRKSALSIHSFLPAHRQNSQPNETEKRRTATKNPMANGHVTPHLNQVETAPVSLTRLGRASSVADVNTNTTPIRSSHHAPLASTDSSASSTSNGATFEIGASQSEAKVLMIKRRSDHSSSLKKRISSRTIRGGMPETTSMMLRFRNRERQAERALILVLLFLICLWLPYFMTNLIYGICPSCVHQGVHDFFHIFAVSSTGAINPLVYIFASRDFKKAVLRIFKKRTFTQGGLLHRNSSRMSSIIAYRSSQSGVFDEQTPVVNTPLATNGASQQRDYGLIVKDL